MSTLKNFVQRAAKVGTQAALQAIALAEQVARLSREVFEQFTGGSDSGQPDSSPAQQVTKASPSPIATPASERPAPASSANDTTPKRSGSQGAPAKTGERKARGPAGRKSTPVPGAAPVPSRWRLEKMRKQELLELCRAHRLDCRPEMQKRELVEMLAELAPRRRKYRMSGGPLPSPVTLLKRPRSYLERLCAEHNVECPPNERKRFIINRLYEKVTGAPPDWERFGEPAHPSR